MNRLLEENAAPTLWTTNLTDEIGPSILRRMMFAMELRMPPPKVRARIWARQLSRHGIESDENDANESIPLAFHVGRTNGEEYCQGLC